jgi:hypothetical protein
MHDLSVGAIYRVWSCGFRGAGARHATSVSTGAATGSRSVNKNRMICMQPFPRVTWDITRFDSRSGRPTFQDLADMGSRSVTGHCNRSGRDARVILRGASLGDVYEARWWPDWTGTGWRTANCAVVSRHQDHRPPRGLQPAGRWPGVGRAGRRNGGHASSALTAVGVLPAGERGPVPSVGRLSGSPPQCPRRPWLAKLVIRSREALCASGRKAYYRRYCSGPRQLHSHGVAHVAVGPGFFNAFIDLRRKWR